MSRIINVKVRPKARINKVTETITGDYVVWTTAAPEDGQANEAVREALAEFLEIKKSAVLIKRGMTSRHKVFTIED